jgi:hypothetical protein
MRNFLTYILMIFIFIFTISCEEKKDNNTTITNVDEQNDKNNILKNIPVVELDEYALEIIDAIIDEDLEKLVSYFGDYIYFGDEPSGNDAITKREWNYNGFLNKQGELYAIFFDTEMLNELNFGNNNPGFQFLQVETVCIRDALKICNALELNFENEIVIDIFGKAKHNEIFILYNNDEQKITYISYNYFPGS